MAGPEVLAFACVRFDVPKLGQIYGDGEGVFKRLVDISRSKA